MLGISQGGVSTILRRYNIPTREGKKITYSDLNLSFFKEINSEESAYFLGLLFADGNVYMRKGQYSVKIKLKKEDENILCKFRDIMSPSSVIKTAFINDTPYSCFQISQKEVCNQLAALGCIPNKSLSLTFPNETIVPPQFIRHFLRGYSDGDGTIYPNKNRSGFNFIWKIISTKQFCSSVAELLLKELEVRSSLSLSRPRTSNNITTTLVVGGNKQSKKVLDWLYQDSSIYLERKYNKYIQFQNYLKENQ